jgi:hypothetical protein
MKWIIIKYKVIFITILSIMETIILGIYLSLIANKIGEGYSLFASIQKVNNSYIYIFVLIICLILQIYIEQMMKKHSRKSKEELVNSILKVACDSFVYPHSNYNIRAIITVCDYRRSKRKTVYSYNILASPEKFAEYDLYFGITGEALKKKIPIAQALNDDHIETYDEETKNYVEPRLKCVLAAPIFSNRNREKVVGILAFDSMESIEKMKFDTDKSKEIAQSWADIFTNIVDE